METVRLSISKIVDGGICVASDDGQKVYKILSDAIRAGKRVEISFDGVTRMTTAFLNAAVGQMYGEFDENTIKAHLASPVHAEPWHLNRLVLVTRRAKAYFLNTGAVESAIDSVVAFDA